MKRILLALSIVFAGASASYAQHAATAAAHAAPQQAATTPPTTLSIDNLSFTSDNHDFGTVAEGGAADYVFQFKNNGNEPIVIQRVQASCGCTTPDWSKDPILPGNTGIVKASYATQGRPGPFTKTLTVVSNAGTKVLTIHGTVEPAPTNSVPQNSSMIRTN